MESTLPLGGRSHGQVAYASIHTCDAGVRFWGWVCSLDLKGDEQVELLLGLVIPELSRSNESAFLEKCTMLIIACVGHNHWPSERQAADVVLFLEAGVFAVLRGQLRCDVLGRFVQALVAFRGQPGLTVRSILPLQVVFATGFLGGYTTFSTMSWEGVQLARGGSTRRSLLYFGSNFVLGLSAALFGLLVG